MYSTKLLSFFALFLLLQTVSGQENFTAYFQPQIAVNYKVAGLYSQNFSVLSRNYIYDREELLFKGRQLDITHYSNLKIRDNQSIALGINIGFGIILRTRRTNYGLHNNTISPTNPISSVLDIGLEPNNASQTL